METTDKTESPGNDLPIGAVTEESEMEENQCKSVEDNDFERKAWDRIDVSEGTEMETTDKTERPGTNLTVDQPSGAGIGEVEMEENQCESVSSSQTVEDDVGNTQQEDQKETIPEMSSRRRRKQQKPQRCSSVEQVAPRAQSEFEETRVEDPVGDYPVASHTLLTKHLVDRYVENTDATVGVDKQTFPQYHHQRKPQLIKSGFHLKLLNRPYYMKGSKGVFRSQPHQCADCGKKFALRDSLKKHISRQHTIKIHQCSFCGKQYRLADSLRKHIKRDHSGETHHCVKCDKYFTSKESLKQHWRIHTGEKPFRCHQCGSAFRYRHHLKQHLQMHSGIMESCEFCGKQYNRRDSLKKHIKEIHDKDDGGIDGLTSDLQESHELRVGRTQDGYHMVSPALLQHMTNPSGKGESGLKNTTKYRVYFCRKCHLHFTCRQIWLRHMQIRHRKVILVCPVCNEQYHLRDSLRKHVKSAHNLKLKDNRNTRAELESRRAIRKSNIQLADVEPDGDKKDLNFSQSVCPTGAQDNGALCTPQDALGIMHFAHMVKLPKCPHCGKCYRLRDSLRKHIKRSHPGVWSETKGKTGNSQSGISIASPGGQLDHTQQEMQTDGLKSSTSGDRQLKTSRGHHQLKGLTGQDLSTDLTKNNSEIIHDKDGLRNNLNSDVIDSGNNPEKWSQESSQDCRKDNSSEITTGKYAFDSDGANSKDVLANNSYNQSLLTKESLKSFNPDDELLVAEHEANQGQGLYACIICTFKFESQQELDIHVHTHPTCPLCKKQYALRDSLRKHIKRSHPADYREMLARKKKSQRDDPNLFVNDSTDVLLGDPENQSQLNQHDHTSEHKMCLERSDDGSSEGQTVHQPNVFVCIICTVSFDSQQELDDHSQTHPTCHLCFKQYSLRDSLRKHIKRSHPADYWEMLARKKHKQRFNVIFNDMASKDMSAEIPKDLMQNSQQNEREMYQEFYGSREDQSTHQPDGLVCMTCYGTFGSQQELDTHVQSHPTCPYCIKQYRDSLRQHIKRTHPEAYRERMAVKGKGRCTGIVNSLRESLRKHIYDKHVDVDQELSNTGEVNGVEDWVLNSDIEMPDAGDQSQDQSAAAFSSTLERSKDTRQLTDCSSGGTDKEVDTIHGAGKVKTQSKPDNTTDESYDTEDDGIKIEQNEVSFNSSANPMRNIFPCTACLLIFDNQEALDYHVIDHEACQYCGKLYTLKDSLRKHIRRSHPIEYSAYGGRTVDHSQMMDPECDNHASSMKEETKQDDEELDAKTSLPYACDLVGEMGSASDATYASHQQGVIYNKEGLSNNSKAAAKHPCSICFLVFDSSEALESHGSSHPTCPHCNKMYRLKDSLSHHIKRSHPNYLKAGTPQKSNSNSELISGNNNLEDPEMARQYLSPSQLPMHELPSVGDVQQEQCEQGKTSNQDSLPNMTPNDSVYPCSTCFLTFDSQEALSYHVEAHPACPHCGKRYKLMDSLRKHIKRSHSKNKVHERSDSFQGEEGSNSTPGTNLVDTFDLDRRPEHSLAGISTESHKLEHSSLNHPKTPSIAKPVGVVFPCPACSLMFDSEETLAVHTSEHPACPFCGRLYSRKNSLRKHIQRSHPDEYRAQKVNNSFFNESYNIDLDDLGEHTVPVGDDVKNPTKLVVESTNKYTEQYEQAHEDSSDSKSRLGDKNKAMTEITTSEDVTLLKCTACDLTFMSPWDLKRHMNFLSCPHCNKHYSIRNSLKKHIQRTHPEAYQESREHWNPNLNNSSMSDATFTMNAESAPVVASSLETSSDNIFPSVNSIKQELV